MKINKSVLSQEEDSTYFHPIQKLLNIFIIVYQAYFALQVSNLKSAVIETSSVPPAPPPPLFSPAPPAPPAPAPPPAPLAPLAPAPPAPRAKKNVPTPGNPLKSFNWSKLPDTKLHGTIWQELDDTKLYNAMDLHTIDKMFCAYQKNGVQVSFWIKNFLLGYSFSVV